jgi:hypothetical protein
VASRPDTAERNRLRQRVNPAPCFRCGKPRARQPDRRIEGALGMCGACYARHNRAAPERVPLVSGSQGYSPVRGTAR